MIQAMKKVTFCFVVGGLLSLTSQVGHCAGEKNFEIGTFQREGSKDWIIMRDFGAATGAFYTSDEAEWEW